jgi:hypothetical protein
MPRTLLSGIIGFSSYFAWFLGRAFVEVPGKNSTQEIVAGCIALILYIVLGQLLLPHDPDADAAEDWRVRASMAAPLLLFALLVLTLEGGKQFDSQVLMVAAGCTGVLLGGFLAHSLTRSAQAVAARAAGASKLLGNIGAGLYASVSVILFALAATALNGKARSGATVVAVLHAVLAAAVLWRIRKEKTPIFAAMFGFLMTMLLAGMGALYMAHGPSMRLAAVAYLAGAVMDMAACGCCIGVAIHRREATRFLESRQ